MKSEQKQAYVNLLEELSGEYQRGDKSKAFAILSDVVAENLRE
jgi:hypothetical protein